MTLAHDGTKVTSSESKMRLKFCLDKYIHYRLHVALF